MRALPPRSSVVVGWMQAYTEMTVNLQFCVPENATEVAQKFSRKPIAHLEVAKGRKSKEFLVDW